jgi:hypothetical protein
LEVFSALSIELFFKIADKFAHTRVPVVLYSVVGASSKDVCDVCPLIPDLTMKDEKHPFLFF